MSESTPTPLIFDFLPALSVLDPHHTYTVAPLSGGLVNLTVRVAISAPTESHECMFGGAETVVAKYAPAYVAAIGERAPFSQYRQVIEARALALLSRPALSPHIPSTVTTPKLIHHDSALTILLMADLGDAPTLDRWLVSDSINAEQAESAGKRFGEFFAHLVGVSEYMDKEDGTLDLQTHFSNPSSQELILSVAVLSVEPHLITCGFDPAEASSLGKICLEMYERQQKPGRTKVFGLGDCWPKSLLVNGDQLSVIDWEFAGMLEPLSDLGQLAAHLFLLYRTSPAHAKPKVKSYAVSMFRAHYEHVKPSYMLEHRVDAWRLFGREVINNAVEIDWWSKDEARKQVEMRLLGRIGAEFIRDAEKKGAREGVLFEEAFQEYK